MPFDDLSGEQKEIVIRFIEDLSTGLYMSELTARNILAGWHIVYTGKAGANDMDYGSITKTDLETLTINGYVTQVPINRNITRFCLTPKALSQYKDYKLSISSTKDVTGEEIRNQPNISFEDQLNKIIDSSQDLLDQLQENYALSREQARKWSVGALITAYIGFCLLIISIVFVILKINPIINITSFSGIISEFIAAIFIHEGDKANKRQDKYHDNLLNRQKILDAAKLTLLLSNDSERDKIMEQIVKNLLGINESYS